jgi:hypothetical protein
MSKILFVIVMAGALTILCGCDSLTIGGTPRAVLFDPHDPKYWGTPEDNYWQEHGYPDPITIP